jgi:hypothetical protein
MSVFHQEDLKTEYTTPARVQVWFLHKSRVQELEAENAALRARLTASKKNGRNVGTGRVR